MWGALTTDRESSNMYNLSLRILTLNHILPRGNNNSISWCTHSQTQTLWGWKFQSGSASVSWLQGLWDSPACWQSFLSQAGKTGFEFVPMHPCASDSFCVWVCVFFSSFSLTVWVCVCERPCIPGMCMGFCLLIPCVCMPLSARFA